MRILINHKDKLPTIKNETLKQALINTETRLYRQAIEQKVYPNTPVAFTYYNNDNYHAKLMGDNKKLLEMLFGTVLAILSEMPPDFASEFHERIIEETSNIEKYITRESDLDE